MVFRHCDDFLSLKVTEGCVDRPLAYDATMLTMLDNENISAFHFIYFCYLKDNAHRSTFL